MSVKVITAPSAIFTLATLRLHARIPTISSAHPEDDLLLPMAEAARSLAQQLTNRAIGQQTLELALDAFPTGAILLPLPPVASVTSVTYIDTAEQSTVLVNTRYALDTYGSKHWLVPAYDTEWPDTLETVNAVKVRYVTGEETVPDALKVPLLLLFTHLYENRGASTATPETELPLGVRSLLSVHRVYGE